MSSAEKSMPRLPLIVGGIALVLVLGLGGGFVKLGLESQPPAQTTVHKVLAGTSFASTTSAAPALPAMPPVPSGAAGSAQTAQDPSSLSRQPLPTMPAPRPAPVQSH